MPSVLFVCTANRFRSPLAAAILKKVLEESGRGSPESWTVRSPEAWRVGSAGTWARPGEPLLPLVADAAQKLGLDLAGHRSARVSGPLLSGYDLILVMQASHREALQSEFPHRLDHIYLLSHVLERGSYDIPDSTSSARGVLEIATDLDELIRRGLRYICVLATAIHNQRQRVE